MQPPLPRVGGGQVRWAAGNAGHVGAGGVLGSADRGGWAELRSVAATEDTTTAEMRRGRPQRRGKSRRGALAAGGRAMPASAAPKPTRRADCMSATLGPYPARAGAMLCRCRPGTARLRAAHLSGGPLAGWQTSSPWRPMARHRHLNRCCHCGSRSGGCGGGRGTVGLAPLPPRAEPAATAAVVAPVVVTASRRDQRHARLKKTRALLRWRRSCLYLRIRAALAACLDHPGRPRKEHLRRCVALVLVTGCGHGGWGR